MFYFVIQTFPFYLFKYEFTLFKVSLQKNLFNIFRSDKLVILKSYLTYALCRYQKAFDFLYFGSEVIENFVFETLSLFAKESDKFK